MQRAPADRRLDGPDCPSCSRTVPILAGLAGGLVLMVIAAGGCPGGGSISPQGYSPGGPLTWEVPPESDGSEDDGTQPPGTDEGAGWTPGGSTPPGGGGSGGTYVPPSYDYGGGSDGTGGGTGGGSGGDPGDGGTPNGGGTGDDSGDDGTGDDSGGGGTGDDSGGGDPGDPPGDDPPPPPPPPAPCFLELPAAAADAQYAVPLASSGHSLLVISRCLPDPAAFADLTGVMPDFYALPYGQSLGAETVVGHHFTTQVYEALAWSPGTGLSGLGDLPGGELHSVAYAVSADGLVVVGYGKTDTRDEAFRWTRAEGMISLWTPAWTHGSYATAISADGSTTVGFGVYSYQSTEVPTAFRWTAAGGLVTLGCLPGSPLNGSEACGVAADGSAVVGSVSTEADGTQAFVWTPSAGVVGLGRISPDDSFSSAQAVTPNGTQVVGYSMSGFDLTTARAFVWDAATGMRDLKTVLMTEYGFELTDWFLQTAYAISPDGRTIVGFGTNPQEKDATWVAHLGPP